MSYDLVVYLKRSAMPSPVKWHSAIVEAGFPVMLDTDFDVATFSGFLPCPVNGEISGFEYYASTVSPEEVEELELLLSTDFSVQFCIGSHSLELVSALAASSVLAAMSSGSLNDPQAGESVSADSAISWAKAQLSQARA
ncbi:hypothetical protein GCM10007160_42120 [Litchfieldella qijiaojingensis]|uniref:Integron gene cassette protein n=1 Tax=Litchfieldella qijiaojingensis TaxID=980347 RepID=A0ABQ2ZEE1_9GAMM|nr:hypothetical protein [Halomonas qijiaojingensis]GGY10489.1 hypothetical protein GCM10007160_42120 [Halomonas qijiaojingensis]